MMKKLLLSAAVAVTLATPAFAQSFTPEFGTANIYPPAASEQGRFGNEAFAYAPQETPRVQRQTWHARRGYQVPDEQQPHDSNY